METDIDLRSLLTPEQQRSHSLAILEAQRTNARILRDVLTDREQEIDNAIAAVRSGNGRERLDRLWGGTFLALPENVGGEQEVVGPGSGPVGEKMEPTAEPVLGQRGRRIGTTVKPPEHSGYKPTHKTGMKAAAIAFITSQETGVTCAQAHAWAYEHGFLPDDSHGKGRMSACLATWAHEGILRSEKIDNPEEGGRRVICVYSATGVGNRQDNDGKELEEAAVIEEVTDEGQRKVAGPSPPKPIPLRANLKLAGRPEDWLELVLRVFEQLKLETDKSIRLDQLFGQVWDRAKSCGYYIEETAQAYREKSILEALGALQSAHKVSKGEQLKLRAQARVPISKPVENDDNRQLISDDDVGVALLELIQKRSERGETELTSDDPDEIVDKLIDDGTASWKVNPIAHRQRLKRLVAEALSEMISSGVILEDVEDRSLSLPEA